MSYLLFTTYFNEPREDRRTEMDFSLMANEPSFDTIFVWAEGADKPAILSDHAKQYKWLNSPQRPTYKDIVQFTTIAAQPTDIVVIANCDIMIPRISLKLIGDNLAPDEAYCLTRYELSPCDHPRLSSHFPSLERGRVSQDTWVTLGSPHLARGGGEYYFGVPGCDNRFANDLQASGYKVSNPSLSIITWHIHGSNLRTPTNSMTNLLPPPYLTITPHKLGEAPEYLTKIRRPKFA